LKNQGKYAAAEPLYRRALVIREKVLGPAHPAVALSLNNLAVLLNDQGQYAAAETLYRRALAIREKTLGPDHPDVALSLNNLAGLLISQGQYAAAEPLCRRALAIREKALGPDHPDIANSLDNLASLLKNQGKYAAAEPLYRRALVIRERSLGPDHPDVALSLNNLAELLSRQGKYAAAVSLYRQSLSISEKALGLDHPYVAISLNNLAALLKNQGQYAAAESLYRRALPISEKALGPDHPDIALILNNLASLLKNQGQYAAAEPLYRRALAINEKALAPDHPDVSLSLNNLALLLISQGQYAAAEPLCRRALAIREKALGPDHPDIANSLDNLAELLSDQGKYAKAEPLYRRSLAIKEKALGPDHPGVALSLNNLAALLNEQGKYAATEPLYRRALAISKKALGPDHPDVARSLNNLVAFLSQKGQFVSASSLLHDSLAIETNWLIRELPLLPDQARSAQLRQLGNAWEFTFGLIVRHPPAAKLALETRLNRQGLLPEIEQRQALLLNASGVDRAKVEQLHALTQQLASVSLQPNRRATVRTQRDQVQAEIYRQIPELQLQPVTIAAVAKALPADGALVEFQRYRLFDGHKARDQRWRAAQYIALILKPDASIQAVQLGPAAPIDAAVLKALGATAEKQTDANALWRQVSDLVINPLLPQLKGRRQWFFSPDGELSRVPFAALRLVQPAGSLLPEYVQLRQLTTGRDLLRLQQPAPNGRPPVVFANPQYDRSGLMVRRSAAIAEQAISQQRSSDLGSHIWAPLPATAQEGQRVAAQLSARLLAGPDASSMRLEQLQSPRVLHIATHGFFVADAERKPEDPLRVIQDDAFPLRGLRQEDPQLRSGLVLAGANQPDADPKDDGYLTALEAVTLNLKGTELVVLSACNTAQGDVRTGEGVYGLQRSLAVAGARSTLLSLWKVDDAATLEFMTRFYKRLKAGEGRADALAATQKEFRDGIPGKPDWKEPYYWAAWQLVGDWRPIKGL
ncbi:MAG: tetratricopeptide repeat protein, partial [Synechococcus sp. ELA057]